jgi:hypothetical protein
MSQVMCWPWFAGIKFTRINIDHRWLLPLAVLTMGALTLTVSELTAHSRQAVSDLARVERDVKRHGELQDDRLMSETIVTRERFTDLVGGLANLAAC